MIACYMCNNANVDPTLNDDNDLSYVCVGFCDKGYSMHIRSGGARPVVLGVMRYDEKLKINVDVAEYAFSFCPNCGRKIFENSEGLNAVE